MPSDEEEEQYYEIFNTLAEDHQGVTLAELTFFFQAMPSTPALSQIEEIFNQCDEDQSGCIDAEEFINVVETIKLLQNKTTNEVLGSFKNAKFTSIFRLADHSREGSLIRDDVLFLLSRLPPLQEEGDAADIEQSLATIVAKHETGDGRMSLEGFLAAVHDATSSMKTAEVIETFMKALKELADRRERSRFLTDIGKGGAGSSHSRPIEDDDDDVTGSSSCDGCKNLRGRARHLRLAAEAEKAVVRETKLQLEEARAQVEEAERMNRDLVFENETLKKKIRDGGVGASGARDQIPKVPSASTLPNSSFNAPPPPTQEDVARLKKSISEKDKLFTSLQSEVDACKKALAKQKQENGRQSAALALLHKHIAQLEKDNELLRKGGDRDLVKEYMARQKLLTAKLEEANRTIETFQQDAWYKDKLDYLTNQKSPSVPSAASASIHRRGWETDPHLGRPAGPKQSVSASPSPHDASAGLPQYRSSGGGGPVAAAAAAAHVPASFAYKNIGRKNVKVEDVPVDPSDEEYRVLSNYYLAFQNTRSVSQGEHILAACNDELDKVNTHHPAYWSGKGSLRIKSWMRRPAVSESIAASLHKKKYIVAGPQRSYSSQQPSVGGGSSSRERAPHPQQRERTPEAGVGHTAHGVALASVAARSVSPKRRPVVGGVAAAAGGQVGGVTPQPPYSATHRR